MVAFLLAKTSWKAAHKITKDLGQMVDRTVLKWFSITINFTNGNTEQEIMDNHDLFHREITRYV